MLNLELKFLENNDWNTYVDNKFASNLFSVIKNSQLSGLPHLSEAASLCDNCKELDIGALAFRAQFEVEELKKKAPICNLCNLLWKTCVKGKGDGFRTVSFSRVESWLRMNGGGTPVLFLCQSPDLQMPTNFQIGLPIVSTAGSQAQFEVMRQWLKMCDEKHAHRASGAQLDDTRLPTRLIDVGTEGEHSVHLWETSSEDTVEYIALSHPWGSPPHFCTYQRNLSTHKLGIPLDDLPATFRDAVIATRALRLRYLWIDSICIIQGPDGDFNVEAKRMEQVFSAAYCVLAASCSLGQTDGFLKPRRERDYVALRQGPDEPPYYVCEVIDDFNTHVLESRLSSRGWVMQEHALARRTIFFTEYQTYWECGDGVRCETGTRMSNSLAAFLGDTNFPQIIISASKGEQILRYQDLYRNYSRLSLTKAEDRPFAIDGLQNRLLKAFDTEGAFGVFDEGPNRGHLRRSLLWHRGDSVAALLRISFPVNRAMTVPSWSWMACTGAIDFLKLEFDGVDWMELRSPWMRAKWEPLIEPTMPRQSDGAISLGGLARDFDVNKAAEGESCIIYDRPEESEKRSLKCVVLGIKRERVGHGARRNYVLITAPAEEEGHSWLRVGAGYLPGRCISRVGSPIVIL